MTPLTLSLEPDLQFSSSSGHETFSANSSTTFNFESDIFQGSVLFMHKLDSDEPHPFASYLRGKRRYWELRWQGRFKSIPTSNDIYFGAEVREYLPELNFLLHATATFILAFGKRVTALRGAGLHCNFGEGDKEHYILFPLHAADTLIVSGPTDPCPDISQPIDFKSNVEMKPGIEITTDNTYTICFYSMYADFLKWQITNIPGLSGTSLTSFLGHQPIHAVVREGPDVHRPRYFIDARLHHTACDEVEEPRTPGFMSAVSSIEYQAPLLPSRRRLSCMSCWRGVIAIFRGYHQLR